MLACDSPVVVHNVRDRLDIRLPTVTVQAFSSRFLLLSSCCFQTGQNFASRLLLAATLDSPRESAERKREREMLTSRNIEMCAQTLFCLLKEAFCLIVEMICLNYLPETDSFRSQIRLRASLSSGLLFKHCSRQNS